jgi:hypothetical protein
METFGIHPSRPVGDIKTAIKDGILDGLIPNDFDKAFAFMIEKGKELGLQQKKSLEEIKASLAANTEE